MIRRMPLKRFNGQIIGYAEIDSVTGDKVVTNFAGQIVAYYYPKTDTTMNFAKQIVGYGDLTMQVLGEHLSN